MKSTFLLFLFKLLKYLNHSCTYKNKFLNINIIKHKTELANIGGILKLEDLFLSLLIKYRKARKLNPK
jgi:hypothetical protein